MSKRKISPEETRERLIDAGLHLFGVNGYECTRTRELADLAQVNQAAIPYHFGGKEGLYRAVAEAVVARGNADLEDMATSARKRLLAGEMTRDEAGHAFVRLLHVFVDKIFIAEDISDRSRFMLREYSSPGAAFDIIYDGLLNKMHTLFCTLVGVIEGRPADDEAIILKTHSLFGNVLSIGIARVLLLKRLGWERLEADKLPQIKQVITELAVNGLQLGDPNTFMEAS